MTCVWNQINGAHINGCFIIYRVSQKSGRKVNSYNSTIYQVKSTNVFFNDRYHCGVLIDMDKLYKYCSKLSLLTEIQKSVVFSFRNQNYAVFIF